MTDTMERRRRIQTLIVVVGLVTLVACGGDADPAQAAECEAIADDGVAVVNDIIESTGDKSVDEFMEAVSDPETSGGLVDLSDDLEGRLKDLDARTEAAGCSDKQLAEQYRERAGAVDGDGFLADLFRTGMERGESPTGLNP